MIALNEKDIIETEIIVMESIGPDIEILIGDPDLRAMTQRFNKKLHISYDQKKSTAFIGNVQLGPIIDTIVESDCIMECVEIKSGQYQWYYQWIWKQEPPPANKVSSVIYYKKFDRGMIKDSIRAWAEGARNIPSALRGTSNNSIS